MTIATLLLALIVSPAAAGPGEVTLLDFQAEWCGPCRQMRPAIDKLSGLGYPIKPVDIDRDPQAAQRYGVDRVPTFVVVDASGKELGRTQGLQSPQALALFFNEAARKATGQAVAPTSDEVGDLGPPTALATSESEDDPSGDAPGPFRNPRPWESTVRIKMHVSTNAVVFGSGTIISSTPEESLILTCAHIFKIEGQRPLPPRQYNRRITVDLFDGQLHGPSGQQLHPKQLDLPAEAVDYDFTHDVGLIRFRPGKVLPASRVVPADWVARSQMRMITVGCSKGHDATAWDTRILEPRVSMSHTDTRQGFTSIKCAYKPIEGRSGGGLYTTDGFVAGVCDFADPNEKTGLYATPDSIHALLDRNRLTALYRPVNGDGADRLLASRTPAARRSESGTSVRAQSPTEDPPRRAAGITLPPPMLAGVKMPKAAPGDWSPPAPETRVASVGRSNRPSPRVTFDDPGAAIATDVEVEPSPDERLADRMNRATEDATTTPRPGKSGGSWTRSSRPFPARVESPAQP